MSSVTIDPALYQQFERVFSSFLIGCNPIKVVAHHRTNAYKDMRRLVRAIRQGPINPSLYKNFHVSTAMYFNPDYFQLTITNKSGLFLTLDNSNYPYLKYWVEHIETAETFTLMR